MLATAMMSLLLPGQGAQETQSPTPLTQPSTWVSGADYPSDLRSVQGRTVAVLKIDARGRVTACDVRGSSGSTILDETVCRRARERGRFTPARDSQGAAIAGSFVFPVLWGKPAIDIQPFRSRLVATMKNGQMVSCVRYDADGNATDSTRIGCTISADLLLQYFGPDYVRADQVTIDSVTIPGNGPVPREPAKGKRVTLKESAATIGPDGRAQTCESRVPTEGPKGSLAACLGLPTDRGFTGLRAFVSAIDWTLRYP